MKGGTLVQHPRRVAILAVAAMLSIVLYMRGRQPAEPVSVPEIGVGYYVRDARLLGTGPDGRMLYRLSAVTAEQVLADGAITMEQVALDYSPAGEAPWEMTAERGQIPPDRNIIILSGDVVATTRSDDVPLTRIRTDYLEFDPDADMASTDHTVAVERDRGTLRARGLRVYLKQDRIQLIGEVRGSFAP